MRIAKIQKSENPASIPNPEPFSEDSLHKAVEDTVSLSLYIAGLCVSLAGLYAFNFNLEDTNFALLSYVLVITGYVLCFTMRRFELSARAAQIPLLIVVGLFCFSGISNGWFAPSVGDDRARSIELMLVYICIFHSFTLTTDTVVMFACVPVMAILSLTSTTSPDLEIEYAFIFFISAATFLMIHENYLRTQLSVVRGRSQQKDKKLFGGQFLLASLCVVTALTLANVVAIPISEIGRRLPISTDITANAADKSKSSSAVKSNVRVTENSSIELSAGPESESDIVLMRVRCDRGLFWRGDTYNDYNGQTFTHPKVPVIPVPAETISRDNGGRGGRFGGPPDLHGQEFGAFTGRRVDAFNQYQIPLGSGEIPEQEMDNSHAAFQNVTVVAGNFDRLYGAGVVQSVRGDIPEVNVSDSGSMAVKSLPVNTSYDVFSRVPDDDPDRLRAASSSPDAYTPAIKRMYLQIPKENEEMAELRKTAIDQTKTSISNYDKVIALQHYIVQTCKYNLNVPIAPKDKDLVHYFLFEAKEGYCTQFAASLTMLCRYAGIPARLASGFIAGELDKDGSYIVREKHKHAWTEVYFPRVGWVPFESTDGSDDITDRSAHSKSAPTSFVGWLFSNGWVPPVVGLVIISILSYIVITELKARMGPRKHLISDRHFHLAPSNQAVVSSYAIASDQLKRAGFARREDQTACEYLSWLESCTQSTVPSLSTHLRRLTSLHERYRYSREIAGAAEIKNAEEESAALIAVIRSNRKLLNQFKAGNLQNAIPLLH